MLRDARIAGHNRDMRGNLRAARGFTMVELMIVVGIIALLASIAIPGYQKITARAHRSEMYGTIGKFRAYFKSVHDSQGTFSTAQTLAADTDSAVNPPSTIPPGQAASWVPDASGWLDLPSSDGGVRMRYWYKMGPDESGKVHLVTLHACGSFPGFGPPIRTCLGGMKGNYLYTELFRGNGTSDVLEQPDF
jgi:prepilin-type N-terminal cleavage/methylation domain-containing protein